MPKLGNMALIGICHLMWKRHLQRGLQDHDITLKQSYLLRHLSETDFLYPADIAEMLFCDRPTATVIINNLEKRGWIERTKDPDNRRRMRVRLAAGGLAKLEELQSRQPHDGGDPMAGLDSCEQEELGRLLRKLRKYLEKLTENSDDKQPQGRTGQPPREHRRL